MHCLYTKKVLTLLILIFLAGNPGFSRFSYTKTKLPSIEVPVDLYDQLQLNKIGLKETVFKKALLGWQQLNNKKQLSNPALLSIADLSQSANTKRLYVIDLEKRQVIFNTYVSHGRNSGEEFARFFGNKPECYKSSLGFYVTGSVYTGTHGISLRLKGMEEGINHHAEQRGIVMHGASYVSEDFIRKHGRLGRSQGCPAVPEEECQPIVNSIKEGSCFFVFYPDSGYFKHSAFYN
jgi:hypothetical protein